MRPLQREKASFSARSKVVPREPASFGCGLVFWVKQGGDRMNLTRQMIPGLIVILGGALLFFLAPKICSGKENAVKVKLIGVLLTAFGAILVFLS